MKAEFLVLLTSLGCEAVLECIPVNINQIDFVIDSMQFLEIDIIAVASTEDA
tara:strand:- start:304 stop:459 length:156 start_codon:yes stop_codon:yes gene_type:complete